MRIEVAGFSYRGTVRESNQDFYCIGPFVEQQGLMHWSLDDASATFTQYGLLASVADGMGGYAGGATASRVALETLSALFYSERREGCGKEEFAGALAGYLDRTQRTLATLLARAPALHDAGTTLAGVALLPPDLLVVFHAGDSRVLRAAAGYVRPLTIDHTPLGPDIAAGRLTEEEAAQRPDALHLTRALGLGGDARVECQTDLTWASGSTFLLGSDGWHGVGRGLSRAAIQAAIRADHPPAALAQSLVEDAVTADGSDNATVVVVALS